MRFTVQLPHHADSVRAARRALDRTRDEVDELTLRNARLLVSELVTNVVRHVRHAGGEDQIRMTVECGDERLRVEVADRGRGFIPSPRADRQDPGSGWGLHILAQLALRWGVESDGETCVWFEVGQAATGGRGRSPSPATAG
jgi:anti-sigma regulatory factor (Ser/Thr protein kinase)